MKAFITLLFSLFVLTASAQDAPQESTKNLKKELSPGDHLIKANRYHTGALVFGAVTAAEILFATNPVTYKDPKRTTILMVLAGVTGSVGVGFGIASWYHIGEAGRKLNAQVDVGLQQNGVGIALKF